MKNGFVKAVAASPVIRVADADYNADRVVDCIRRAAEEDARLLVFPALTLTGCSCCDLFAHRVLLDGAVRALLKVLPYTEGLDMLVFVGLPFAHGARVFNAAAVLYDGEIRALALADLRVAVEVGAGLDRFPSPCARHAEAGATVVVQMAAFPETVSSRDEAELNARYESRQFRCGLLLAAPGTGESTTDHAWSGLCLAAENGSVLAVSESDDAFAVTEFDVEHMVTLRRAAGCFDSGDDYLRISWGEDLKDTVLTRRVRMHPHLPESEGDLPEYCRRMLDMQVSGLAKRMRYAGLDHCVVGISGGVDSTLAVLVSSMAVKKLGLPPENVIACTMPCFGTSSRTKNNAVVVARQLGAEVRIIDISQSVLQHFKDIGHAEDDYSVAYENAQARERTQILMDISNKTNGLDVGTEDLSEYIDGWCTYNGDHTSMYDVNLGLTKTQVRANVRYIADTTEDRVLKDALLDVLDCPVTPELLPIHDDQIEQKSEEAVGPYSLQDFFTHKILVCGFTPSKTFRLAKAAYGEQFTDKELLRWLTGYCRRLFSQQFKRSCLMDGPAVEDFSVSPRAGFLLPSDAENADRLPFLCLSIRNFHQ